MKKIKNKIGFKLFYNDKFVMFFSVLVAFIAWICVASTTQESSIFTVTDIPINLPELTDGLRYFNGNDIKAEVKISGNALVVTGVTKDDIYITASDTSMITGPGEYTLDLVPKKSGVKTDYSFESSVTPSNIKVLVDRYVEGKTFQITDKITTPYLGKGKYKSKTVLSRQSVKISGAESIVNNISEVCAEYEMQSELTETVVLRAPLVFYDKNGDKITSSYITPEFTDVDATVPVQDVLEIPVTVRIRLADGSIVSTADHLPEPVGCVAQPDKVRLGVPDPTGEYSVITDVIDFTKAGRDNDTFTVPVEISAGCNNIDNIENVTVTFDFSKVKEKTLVLNKSRIKVLNQGSDQTAAVTNETVTLTIYGPEEEIKQLTVNDLEATVDIGEKSTRAEGYEEMPLDLKFTGAAQNCWVNKEYTVNVRFSPKTVTQTSTAPAVSTSSGS